MTQTYKKKLIEVAIPLSQININAYAEKSRKVGKPSSIHLWWARRPFAATRAMALAQVIDDPSEWREKFSSDEDVNSERIKIFNLIDKITSWEFSTDENTIYELREIIAKYAAWRIGVVAPTDRLEIDKIIKDKIPDIYDPFCGGGGTAFEAQRLGLNTSASDINPVAVTITKALVEVPQIFSGYPPINKVAQNIVHNTGVWNNKALEGISEDIEYYCEELLQLTNEKVDDLYPKLNLNDGMSDEQGEVIAWIWARTVASPNPALRGAHVPLVKSFTLSSSKGKFVWIDPIVDKTNLKITYEIRYDGKPEINKTMLARSALCLYSNDVISHEYIKEEARNKRLGMSLMAIVTKGKGKRVYHSATKEHEIAGKKNQELYKSLGAIENLSGCTNCVVYGLQDFADLFTGRQYAVLSALFSSVEQLRKKIRQDALDAKNHIEMKGFKSQAEFADKYADAITIYLSLILSRVVDWNSSMSRWESKTQVPQQTFGRQAIPMVWDFSEANPFGTSTGSVRASAKNLIKALESCKHAAFSNAGINIFQSDISDPDVLPKNCVISTDPPYYDNIPYSNLSDYFYHWLKKSLKKVYPDIFVTLQTPKQNEIVANRNRHGSVKLAEEFFLNGMKRAFVRIAKIADDEYPLAIFYAFKQSDITSEGTASTGWATFLEAVINSGLTIERTWPVRTENSTRMMAQGNNALANSVVLVCRKAHKDASTITRTEFIRELKSSLPSAITEFQAANVSPADMPQAAIGPGIAVFSRYSSVLESDDSHMAVKAALQLINAELDEFLNDLHGDFDPDTRFAATWFEQNGFEKGNFGAANSLATARGISVDSVKHAGIVESSAGRVRILKRDELDPNWDPNSDSHLTVWECCQYLVREYEDGGETAAAMLIKKMGYEKADAVKDLAYYLYDICSNKRQDAKEATSYNALIAGWNDIMRMANSIHETDTTRQASLF